MAMFKAEHLSKQFSGLRAVNDVSFEIEEGTITGMIGPNGAGKTTLFNLVSGVYKPTEGKAFYKGKDITNLPPHAYANLGIGRTFQIMKPLKTLSVEENVISGAYFGRSGCRTYKEAKKASQYAIELTGLQDVKNVRANDLNTPLKKRLEVARALATKPEFLLLDEVMAGLNPTETVECIEMIKHIKEEEKLTVFMIEHIMQAVVSLSERVIVLHHGEKIAEGTPEEVMNNPSVIEVYLGEEEEHAQG